MMTWTQCCGFYGVGMVQVIVMLLITGGALGSRIPDHLSPTHTTRRRVVIVTTPIDPYVRLKWEPRLIGIDRYEGFYVDVMAEVARMSGMEYQLRLVADGLVGSVGEDGEWNGLIGELISGRADMALAPVLVTEPRQQNVDLSTRISSVKVTAIFSAAMSLNNFTEWSDLLADETMRFGVVRNSDIAFLLQQSDEPLLREIWNKMVSDGVYVNNIHEGIARARHENFSLIVNYGEGLYHSSAQPCDLVSLQTPYIAQAEQAIAFANDSEWVETFKVNLNTLKGNRESWLRMRRRWWSDECRDPTGDGNLYEESQEWEDISLHTSASSTLNRRRLRIASYLERPYLEENDSGYQGYTAELVQKLSEMIGFEYDWQMESTKGRIDRRGRATGVVGALMSGAADFGAAPFSEDSAYNDSLTLSRPFLHSSLSVLLLAPSAAEGWPIFFLEDLLNHTELQLGVVKHSRFDKELRRSNDRTYRALWRKIRRANSPPASRTIMRSLEEGLVKIRQGNFAMLVESTDAAYVSSQPPCDLLPLDQFRSVAYSSLAVRKGNPLVEELNEALLTLRNTGELQRLYHRWWNTGECFDEEDEDERIMHTPPPVINHQRNTSSADQLQTQMKMQGGSSTVTQGSVMIQSASDDLIIGVTSTDLPSQRDDTKASDLSDEPLFSRPDFDIVFPDEFINSPGIRYDETDYNAAQYNESDADRTFHFGFQAPFQTSDTDDETTSQTPSLSPITTPERTPHPDRQATDISTSPSTFEDQFDSTRSEHLSETVIETQQQTVTDSVVSYRTTLSPMDTSTRHSSRHHDVIATTQVEGRTSANTRSTQNLFTQTLSADIVTSDRTVSQSGDDREVSQTKQSSPVLQSTSLQGVFTTEQSQTVARETESDTIPPHKVTPPSASTCSAANVTLIISLIFLLFVQ